MYCKLWSIRRFGECEIWLALTLFQSREVRNFLEGPVAVIWWFLIMTMFWNPKPL